jgi:hypothetical protein
MVVPQHVVIRVEPLAIGCLPSAYKPSEVNKVHNFQDFPFFYRGTGRCIKLKPIDTNIFHVCFFRNGG